MNEELRAVATADHPYPADRFSGRGLVMCAGGSRLLVCAWVALGLLRRVFGCSLPIQVWHLGPEELGPYEADLFAELDVETVDALQLTRDHPARILGGWELKPYALVNTRFQEVLLLDADNIPVRDPAFLLDTVEFAETGALFWPDLVRLSADSAIWDVTGVEFRNEPAWESGQVVMDKARCWRALQVALWMNEHSDEFYEYLHGDKDTFHLAWRMLDQPVAMTSHRAKPASFGIRQHDFEGNLLFQHRNAIKWVLHGDNPRVPGFAFEKECLALVHELARRWSGKVEALPQRTARDRRMEDIICSQRWFRFDDAEREGSVVELLPGNRVGEGTGTDALRWWVAHGELTIVGVGGVSSRFAEAGDGRWQGRAGAGGLPAGLTPLVDGGGPLAAAVAAVTHAVAEGTVDVDAAVTTIVTLARLGDLGEVVAREHSRWKEEPTVAEVLDQALMRIGRRNPSRHLHGIAAGQRYEGL